MCLVRGIIRVRYGACKQGTLWLNMVRMYPLYVSRQPPSTSYMLPALNSPDLDLSPLRQAAKFEVSGSKNHTVNCC